MTVFAIGAGAAILVLIFALIAGRSWGQSIATVSQLGRDREALDERLEMNRDATDIERAAADRSDEDARKEAKRWSRG